MWLRKTRLTPGGAPGGFEWNTPADVVEVPDDLGLDLLEIPGAGFEEAPAPAAKQKATEPAPEAEPEAPAEVVEAPTVPKKRAARKPSATEVTE